MTHSTLLFFHIAGALVGLVSGWAAIFLRKGSRLHGAAGNAFFISMLTMCVCGVTLAAMKQQVGNILGGTLTFYLVATAWLTVKRNHGTVGLAEKIGRGVFRAEIAEFPDEVLVPSAGLYQVMRDAIGNGKIGLRAELQVVVGELGGAGAPRAHVDDADFLPARAPVEDAREQDRMHFGRVVSP